MSFDRYPMVMNHPHYKPAVPYKQPRFKPGEEGWGKPVDPGTTGKPAMFPPVTVNNLDQEQQYAAKGYTPAGGGGDPEAYRKQMTNVGRETQPAANSEFPKMMYKVKPGPRSGTPEDFDAKTVKSVEEQQALEKKGWSPKMSPAEGDDDSEAPDESEQKQSQGERRGRGPLSDETKAKIAATMKRKAEERKRQREAAH